MRKADFVLDVRRQGVTSDGDGQVDGKEKSGSRDGIIFDR